MGASNYIKSTNNYSRSDLKDFGGTYVEIGKKLGLSKERVRQILEIAKPKFRALLIQNYRQLLIDYGVRLEPARLEKVRRKQTGKPSPRPTRAPHSI